MEGQGLALIAVKEQGSGLQVGQMTLLWPAPTDAPVAVVLVEGTNLANAVPLHVPGHRLPEQAEPISLLLWRPARHFSEIS